MGKSVRHLREYGRRLSFLGSVSWCPKIPLCRVVGSIAMFFFYWFDVCLQHAFFPIIFSFFPENYNLTLFVDNTSISVQQTWAGSTELLSNLVGPKCTTLQSTSANPIRLAQSHRLDLVSCKFLALAHITMYHYELQKVTMAPRTCQCYHSYQTRAEGGASQKVRSRVTRVDPSQPESTRKNKKN